MLQKMLNSPVPGVSSAYSVLDSGADSGAVEALAAGLQVVASAFYLDVRNMTCVTVQLVVVHTQLPVCLLMTFPKCPYYQTLHAGA